MDTSTLSNIALLVITLLGMYTSAFWLAMIIWTYRDHRARSRDGLASLAAALTVAVLNIPGLIIYLLLRPKETLSEAYERSLEEEALLQEIEEKPVCPGCGRPSQPEWQACPYCHTRLRKACITCGKPLELAWSLCPYCASSQVGYALEEEPAARPRRGKAPYSDAMATPRGQQAGEPIEFIDGDQF